MVHVVGTSRAIDVGILTHTNCKIDGVHTRKIEEYLAY